MSLYPKNLIIYKITYLPWMNNVDGKPWMYIGSTSRDFSKYFGSVSSKEYAKFWRTEVKLHPEKFQKEIIFNCILDGKEILLEVEDIIHRDLDVVKSNQYFNKSFANLKGMFGRDVSGSLNQMFGKRHSKEWKIKHSIISTEVGNRPEIKKARSIMQLEIQNRPNVKDTKSKTHKARWKASDAGVQKNKDAWCPKTKIYFNNFVFTSRGNFDAYIIENGYTKILSRNYLEYSDINISDLDIIQRNINIVGLMADYDIFDINNVLELSKVNISKIRKTRFISEMTKISFNVVPRILKKFENRENEIKILLDDIKNNNIKFPLISKIGAIL